MPLHKNRTQPHYGRRERGFSREEYFDDYYFGNNDPVYLSEEYRYHSMLEGEAGHGYADSAYRRRREPLPDTRASYELNYENNSQLDDERYYDPREENDWYYQPRYEHNYDERGFERQPPRRRRAPDRDDRW